MEKERNLVIIGDEQIGKTTLANALLGWDIFPQTNDGWYMPTKGSVSRMLTDSLRLTDTPGYDLLWNAVPDDTVKAVSRADVLIVMLSETLEEEEIDIPSVDPDWEKHRGAEQALLEKLLANGKTRRIYFVIPFYTEDWPEGKVPLSQGLRLAKKRFASMSDLGEDGFFCVDPMLALIGAIEDDREALEKSGILPLKSALLGAKE